MTTSNPRTPAAVKDIVKSHHSLRWTGWYYFGVLAIVRPFVYLKYCGKTAAYVREDLLVLEANLKDTVLANTIRT